MILISGIFYTRELYVDISADFKYKICLYLTNEFLY